MISSNKLYYAKLTNLSTCKSLSNNSRFICKRETPLYSVRGNNICETVLVLNDIKIPIECDTRISLINTEQ